MTALRVRFTRPAKLGPDAALALEDYARASSSFPASLVLDASGRIEALDLESGANQLPDGVAGDIERFFDSLTMDPADRLGWS